jgi:putative ABC transport system permease protein
MSRFRRTPLAWKNLTHNVRRLLVAVSGVVFAVVLMFMERGFRNALFDSTVELVRNFDADIVLVSGARYSLSTSSRFPLSTLWLTRGCPGVEAAYPIYVENFISLMRRPDCRSRPIRVVGFNIRDPVFIDELEQRVQGCQQQLRVPRTALIDVTSKESIYELDPVEAVGAQPLTVELAGKQVQLIGNFHLGTDFANNGTLLMSLENFAFYFPLREMFGDPLSTIDMGLVVCEPGADPRSVQQRLRKLVGRNVTVYTRQQLVDAEISVWDQNTPIGVIFRVGMIMGFVVGILICYQVLYNDITDHMAEFATLVAMGYSQRYFVGVVVREAFYLALLGFVPGLAITWVLFQLITLWTGLTMTLALPNIVFTLALTVIMCVVSGLLAVRKLLAADPASLF